MGTRKESGFSLLVVIVVAAIGTIVTATALPNMVNGIANVRLRWSTTSLADVIQNCRMLSVKQSQTMTTHFTPTATGLVAYVKQADDASSYTANDSQVELEAPVIQTTAPTGAGAPPALDSTILGFSPLTGDPSFNTTGLPCAFNSGVCPVNGFVYYFHDFRPQGQQGWAALSISPAGGLKKWFWSGNTWNS